MMATVYASKIDGWLAAVLVLSMAISAWASVQVIVAGPAVAWWIVLLTAGAGVGLPLWILSSTNYTIAPTHLRIKSGPFRWQIPIVDISGITPTSNPLSSPALSLDRLRIDYGRGASVMISPRNKEQFIRDIETLRGQRWPQP